mmetsp:Transcript_83351/g.139083  ORF Transcript_83351/g.139083 Transcript_83351/m.139083 type:complete len:261 (+) Transcript_83351:35-817(+)
MQWTPVRAQCCRSRCGAANHQVMTTRPSRHHCPIIPLLAPPQWRLLRGISPLISSHLPRHTSSHRPQQVRPLRHHRPIIPMLAPLHRPLLRGIRPLISSPLLRPTQLSSHSINRRTNGPLRSTNGYLRKTNRHLRSNSRDGLAASKCSMGARDGERPSGDAPQLFRACFCGEGGHLGQGSSHIGAVWRQSSNGCRTSVLLPSVVVECTCCPSLIICFAEPITSSKERAGYMCKMGRVLDNVCSRHEHVQHVFWCAWPGNP